MKFIKIVSCVILAAIISTACENQDIDFPDFENNAVYFPIQFPVRTLSLGNNDRIDNSLDRELKFHIGVSIGGMYQNNDSWRVDFTIDNSLVDSLLYNNDTLKVLPAEYYTLSSNDHFIIPPGSFNGLVQVQLSEQFLSDPKAISPYYVIPLRITGTDADSILKGVPAVENPDRRISSHWVIGKPPRDFVLFCVKYVNHVHGTWLRRGAAAVFFNGEPLKAWDGVRDSVLIYRQKFVESDARVFLSTISLNGVTTNALGPNVRDDGTVGLKLSLDDEGNITVQSREGTMNNVLSGSGKYLLEEESVEEWGGFKREAIYLSYEYEGTAGITFKASDTLVFRDRALSFETFTPQVLGFEE